MKKELEQDVESMPTDDIKNKLQQEKEICSLYIDCSKTYIQLSTGALLLSLTFYDEIIGKKEIVFASNWGLLLTWFFWLFTILTGVTYQYCVIKYLEVIANKHQLLYYNRTWKKLIPRIFRDNPYLLYGAMAISFYAGIILFTFIALKEIIKL